MINKVFNKIKATIKFLIVAILFSVIIILATNIIAGDKIKDIIETINMISIEKNDSDKIEFPIKEENSEKESKNIVIKYPEFGTQYANIYIESIGIELPVFFGDTTDILRKGVGHYSGSYFPGEGGSIVYAAHNTQKFFKSLPQIKDNDIIKITTNYGEFYYKVYETQIINATENDKLPIQSEEEILMLYTCYPVTGIEHKTQRFLVFARLLEE